MNYNLPRVATR